MALAAKAEIIVSGERHLLELKKHQGIRSERVAEAVKIPAGPAPT
jgi:predicted nucleic acid-binding protein